MCNDWKNEDELCDKALEQYNMIFTVASCSSVQFIMISKIGNNQNFFQNF